MAHIPPKFCLIKVMKFTEFKKIVKFQHIQIDHIFDHLKLHYGDLVDSQSFNSLVSEIKPDEIYNLGAQSHVKVSFEIPDYTAQVDALGTLRFS